MLEGTSYERGRFAEALALKFLEQQGLTLITKNFRSRLGEIDLIMRDKDCLVFVEVRYRTAAGHGSGLESISYYKQQRLIKTALIYLQKTAKNPYKFNRFDAVGIEADRQIKWIKNAFEVQY